MDGHILSWTIFLPLLVSVLVLLLPNAKTQLIKGVTVAGIGAQFLLSLLAYFSFNGASSEIQLVEKASWIEFTAGSFGTFKAEYFLGVDGLNILLVLLSTFVLLVASISAWSINKNVKGYSALLLVLSTAVVGCFASLDMLLFFVFFEFMLLPMYFLIGIWGGPKREYAAIKFFIYTLVGSVAILMALIGLYNSVMDPIQTALNIGLINDVSQASQAVIINVQELMKAGQLQPQVIAHSFNMLYMSDMNNLISGSVFDINSTQELIGISGRTIGFWLLFIGFIIKLPAVPLHTWLPDAHVQAPTSISVILAGIMLKIGGYGLLRIAYPAFPEIGAEYAMVVTVIAVVTIVYAAYVSLGQKELKKLVAYSSVSHMGFVILGIASYTSEGINGAVYQMISHGIISPMLFLVAGVIYDRTGNLLISEYKGLVNKMPVFTAFTTVAFFASLGLPGFSGFIAEIFVFIGAFASGSTTGLVPHWAVFLALLGLVITAGYYLWTLQRIYFGKFWVSESDWTANLKDLTVREYILLIPLAVLTLLLGVMPSLILNEVSATVNQMVELLSKFV